MFTIGILLIFISSCNSDDYIPNDVEEEQTRIEFAAGPYIKVGGKLHRGTRNRPRDGKDCNCSACFGICEFTVTVGWDFLVAPDPNGTTATIYIMEEYSYAESEFGIDDDLLLYLDDEETEYIIFKEGLYNYVEDEQPVVVSATAATSYGYVVVDIETNL